MILKITGFGFKKYIQDKMNLFDGIIACISVINFIKRNYFK